MVLPDSRKISRVPRYSGTMSRKALGFRLRGYNPLWRAFSDASTNQELGNFPKVLPNSPTSSHNPHTTTPAGLNVAWVWAVPVSLAATQGIAIAFSSSGYLDVSVPRVRLRAPMDSGRDIRPQTDGLSHSEINGSKPVCRLAVAYRRLPRPSSPPRAKAFTVRLQ